MNRAFRFITLSGLSGVSTGITALVGVLIAYVTVFKHNDYLTHQWVGINNSDQLYLVLIALGTFALSIVSAIYFTRKKRENKTKTRGIYKLKG